MRYPDGVGRLVAANRRRLRAHELIELLAHRIRECANAGSVPFQRVSASHLTSPFLTDKTLDVTVYTV